MVDILCQQVKSRHCKSILGLKKLHMFTTLFLFMTLYSKTLISHDTNVPNCGFYEMAEVF
jgi:hypothetical protein